MKQRSSIQKLALFILTLMLTLTIFSQKTSAQYCTTGLYISYGCTDNDYVNSFSTTGGSTNITNNNTGCGSAPATTGYSNYTSMVHSGIMGTTVNFSFQSTLATWSEGYKIWVDFNGNTIFDASELVYASAATIAGGGTVVTGSFTIPLTATPGLTRLRIRCVFNTTTFGPCDQFTFGEVEDYGFMVVANTPCSGIPNAIATVPASVCPNTNFNMSVAVTPIAGGLTYSWEKSMNGINGWTSFSTSPSASDNITVPTYYHCIVTCTNTPGPNNSFTTPAALVNLNSYYTCYCLSQATLLTATENIGRFNIWRQNAGDTVLVAGPGLPLYNFTPIVGYTNWGNTISPPLVYRDTLYNFYLQQVQSSTTVYTTTTVGYIDFNHNGLFDANEKVFTKNPVASSTPPLRVTDTFTIPHTALLGITGMRIIVSENTPINPCGTYLYGETEDYLININYPPCNGPTNPGIALTTDTAMCPNYPYTLTDTTHERYKSGISWSWQQSTTNGNTWTHVPSSGGKDTLNRIFTNTVWYRLRMACSYTHDTTYSNVIKINLKPPYKCYGFSTSEGNNMDSSDIGAFSIGDFIMNTGGPHVLNPLAVRGRTDYTDVGPIELYSDSTYNVVVYHTMRSLTHADAYITMFIDFNNNLQYDLPQEAIYLKTPNPPTDWLSTASNWYVINRVHIPTAVIPDVPTGLRVILNNDVTPGMASTTAYGKFTSGETEDYTVVFRRHTSTNIDNTIKGMENLALYPNPTDGNFTVSFNATQSLQNVQINVMDITGRIIKQVSYGDIRGGFTHQLDLTSESKGIYFVEVRAENQKITRRIVVK